MTRPGMADGRCFTTYLPSGILNAQMQKQFSVNTGPQYRTFLQENAQQIKEEMRKMSIVQSGDSEMKFKEANTK
tara:strand:- start:7130 stop:7351 length:222 start_codon:yes stop_codon:yes gene_type:complete